jgi:hypothetical protein
MNKYILVSAMSISFVANATAATAAPPTSSSGGKMSNAMHKVGAGIMWGPKKIGNGLKAAGEKTKSMFHKK